MRFILTILFIVNACTAFSNNIGFGWMFKMEFNRSVVFNNSSVGEVKSANNPFFGTGPYIYIDLNKNYFLDANVIFSTNSYKIHYSEGENSFVDSKIRFAEIDFRLNRFIFKNKNNSGLYLSAGVQNLYRRWGQETFVNDVIANSYWPDSRWVYSFGIGSNHTLNDRHSFRILAGANYKPDKQVLYDTDWYQYHLSIIFTSNYKINKRSKIHTTCPNQF